MFFLRSFCVLHGTSKFYLEYNKTNRKDFLLFLRSYSILADIMIPEVNDSTYYYFP